MVISNAIRQLYNGPIIPAIRTMDDLDFALTNTTSPSLVVLFGDINILPEILEKARKAKKRLLIHIDLLEGIGKDRAGFTCLSRMGVNAIITTKVHIAKLAREHGMLVIQRLFIVDSEAVRTGIKMANHFKPDAIEVLPSTVPEKVVKTFIAETGVPIFAGGCIYEESDVRATMGKGVVAVSTHQRDLWN